MTGATSDVNSGEWWFPPRVGSGNGAAMVEKRPGRGRRAERCDVCGVVRPFCICEHLPRLDTVTELVLVVHRDELDKPSNTGLLATRCLPNSRVLVRGEREGLPPLPWWDASTREAWILFPADDAVPLAEMPKPTKPLSLVVPDGTWGQAARLLRRVPGLSALPRVRVDGGPRSRYFLRSEPRDDGLATIEALARALRVVESPECGQALEALFKRFVANSLLARSGRQAPVQVAPSSNKE